VQEAGSRERWRLSQASFDGLLAALSEDRRIAAERYERIRARLIKFFAWERGPFPEDHADETINRVAKRVSEGEELLHPDSYFYGVARMVLKETIAENRRRARAVEELHQQAQVVDPPGEPEEKRTALDCLSRCLQHAGAEQRSFILRYYQGERRLRIENRRRMARELDVPLNALRNRALRLREKLENCVSKCLNARMRA
jgi:DNA-directed RNA polymerase specialized sigma24 family protein